MSAAKPPAPARRLFIAAGCLAALAIGLIISGGAAIMYALRLDDAGQIARSVDSARPLPRAAMTPDPSPIPPPIADTVAPEPNQEPSPEPEPTPAVNSEAQSVPEASPRPRSSSTPSQSSESPRREPEPVAEPEPAVDAEPNQPRGIRGRLQARRERRRHFPLDGTYNCYSGNGGKLVQQFEIDEDTYEDLLEEEDGEFSFDLSDNTMTFTEGPFVGRFLGVSVRQGEPLKASSRFRFSGDYGTAAANIIHLVAPDGRYSKRSGLGIRCVLEE